MSLLIVNTIQPQTGSIVNISGSLQISQSLIVADDITLSGKLTLGDANTDNIIVNSEFTSSLIPDVDGAFNLGTGVKKWGTVFAKSGSFDNISGSVNLTDGLVTITSASVSYLSGSSPITVGGAMIPDVTNTHNLGSAAKKYNDLFINDISASGDVTSSGTGSFTGGIDAANATGSFGYISASGTISTSGNILANSITAENGGELTGVIATPAQPQITSLGTITNLAVTNMTSSGNVTASSFQTNNITITAGGHVSASRVSASNGFEADTASTSSFGHISASGDISTSANLLAAGNVTAVNLIGTLATAAQTNITSLGTIPQLFTTNITASNNISASSFLTNNVTITGGHISASRVSASAGFEADTASTSSFGHISASGDVSSAANIHGEGTGSFVGGIVATGATGSFGAVYAGNISASNIVYAQRMLEVGLLGTGTSNIVLNGQAGAGHISASGKVSASGFDTVITTAASSDTFSYSVNGRKVEVRNQLQAQLNDGTFTHLELRNTEIATDSIVLGSFTGNTATNITGSIITAATTALYTASIQIHNETGENIANDTAFTASFIVL